MKRMAALVLAACAAGCATLPAAQVQKLEGGGFRVDVEEAQSFRALAATVYGDPKLGDGLAASLDMAPTDSLEAGASLTLPSRDRLEDEMERAGRVAR
ncbi:MAG: hypothetical protein HKN12_07260, partial [Gemmatimonadetes bacterium]|nr:hypothetical protein [Gemmatimonadota bacterium]